MNRQILQIAQDKNFIELELSYCGFQVCVVNDLPSALNLPSESKPILLILDLLWMSDSELEALENLRALYSQIPFILLTSMDRDEIKIYLNRGCLNLT
jgi:DNA-binding response OmpR family regulator